ncbi:MAG: DUF1501 domain-containing protein [Planctomycetaceae bacterium]
MLSRRELLQSTISGFGALAWAALSHEQAALANSTGPSSAASPLAPRTTHFAPRARRVIFLCMEGGPSHVDTFDHKPRLTADAGKPAPRARGRLLGSPFSFSQHGQSGLWVSELFSNVARHADRLCVLNGVHTDLPNHAQAFLQMHCGLFQFPRPSLGAWVLYGLGTENGNLPGFVTINPPQTNGGAANYAASFLPAVYQGTRMGARNPAAGAQISNLKNARRDRESQRLQLDYIQQLNRSTASQLGGDSSVDGLISAYELAYRMQGELPPVLDLSEESAATQALYGITETGGGGRNAGPFQPGGGGPAAFGRQCLLASRLVEAGVRFVEVTSGGWDHHRNLQESLTNSCRAVDQPIAGLLTDLAARGLLEETLVIWGGEFGRSPAAQGDGRDHNNKGFTLWMAGGGVKPGLVYGRTDDYGMESVEGKVHIHDWHATILHLLGLDHEKLTYRHAGRDMRLTDVKGNVVHEIVA